MEKYKVIEAFETPAVEAVEASEGVEAVEAKEAVAHNVDDILELSDEQAAELAGKVEKVEVPGASTPTPPAAEVPPARTEPVNTTAAPSADSKPAEAAPQKKSWAGGHVVGANKPEKGRGK